MTNMQTEYTTDELLTTFPRAGKIKADNTVVLFRTTKEEHDWLKSVKEDGHNAEPCCKTEDFDLTKNLVAYAGGKWVEVGVTDLDDE